MMHKERHRPRQLKVEGSGMTSCLNAPVAHHVLEGTENLSKKGKLNLPLIIHSISGEAFNKVRFSG